MRILAISDTKESWLYDHFDRKRLEGVDLIVSCGDLPARYLEHIVTLANVPLVYVQGNHDTAYDENPPEGCVSIDGQLRDCRGLRIMGLGGSIRYNNEVHGFTEAEMARTCRTAASRRWVALWSARSRDGFCTATCTWSTAASSACTSTPAERRSSTAAAPTCSTLPTRRSAATTASSASPRCDRGTER